MDAFLEFARGPLFVATFLFMVFGLGRHVLLRTRDLIQVLKRTPKRDVPWRDVASSSAGWMVPVKHLMRAVPILSVASVLFHAGLVLVPIFLAAHVFLWSRSIGIGLPTLSAELADTLTLMTIGCGAMLFLVRVMRKAARDLSRLQDYGLLLAVLLPFVSGWFAVHPESSPLAYRTMMLLHVLSAELVFVLMPTTKLAHVVLFPFDRLSGDIFWRLVPGAGDRVAESLRGTTRGAEVKA
ncbi:MAG: hypothetical protein ABFS86_03825 [Planctomycetota bacterium]